MDEILGTARSTHYAVLLVTGALAAILLTQGSTVPLEDAIQELARYEAAAPQAARYFADYPDESIRALPGNLEQVARSSWDTVSKMLNRLGIKNDACYEGPRQMIPIVRSGGAALPDDLSLQRLSYLAEHQWIQPVMVDVRALVALAEANRAKWREASSRVTDFRITFADQRSVDRPNFGGEQWASLVVSQVPLVAASNKCSPVSPGTVVATVRASSGWLPDVGLNLVWVKAGVAEAIPDFRGQRIAFLPRTRPFWSEVAALHPGEASSRLAALRVAGQQKVTILGAEVSGAMVAATVPMAVLGSLVHLLLTLRHLRRQDDLGDSLYAFPWLVLYRDRLAGLVSYVSVAVVPAAVCTWAILSWELASWQNLLGGLSTVAVYVVGVWLAIEIARCRSLCGKVPTR